MVSREMNCDVHAIGQLGQCSNVQGFCSFDHPSNVRELVDM